MSVTHSSPPATGTNEMTESALQSVSRRRGLTIDGCIDCRPLDVASIRNFEILGWGETQSGNLADVLMIADVQEFDRAQCRRPSLFGSTLTDSMFCAGGAGRDSCIGDSGGPIVVPSQPEQVAGITSFGKPDSCGAQGVPVVYTLINPFISWVNSIIGNQQPSTSPVSSPSIPSVSSPSLRPSGSQPTTPSTLRPSASPPSTSQMEMASWWRPEIVDIIKSSQGGGIEDVCSRGGSEWLPNMRGNGCEACSTYFLSTTIATCRQCCCNSGSKSQQWTYSGCSSGLRSSSTQVSWSPAEWNAPLGRSASTSGSVQYSAGSSSQYSWGSTFYNYNG